MKLRFEYYVLLIILFVSLVGFTQYFSSNIITGQATNNLLTGLQVHPNCASPNALCTNPGQPVSSAVANHCENMIQTQGAQALQQGGIPYARHLQQGNMWVCGQDCNFCDQKPIPGNVDLIVSRVGTQFKTYSPGDRIDPEITIENKGTKDTTSPITVNLYIYEANKPPTNVPVATKIHTGVLGYPGGKIGGAVRLVFNLVVPLSLQPGQYILQVEVLSPDETGTAKNNNGAVYTFDLQSKAKVEYIIVDDQAPASDVVLAVKLQSQHGGQLKLDSEVTRSMLGQTLALLVDNGQVIAVVGGSAPAPYVTLANQISGRNTKINTDFPTDDFIKGPTGEVKLNIDTAKMLPLPPLNEQEPFDLQFEYSNQGTSATTTPPIATIGITNQQNGKQHPSPPITLLNLGASGTSTSNSGVYTAKLGGLPAGQYTLVLIIDSPENKEKTNNKKFIRFEVLPVLKQTPITPPQQCNKVVKCPSGYYCDSSQGFPGTCKPLSTGTTIAPRTTLAYIIVDDNAPASDTVTSAKIQQQFGGLNKLDSEVTRAMLDSTSAVLVDGNTLTSVVGSRASNSHVQLAYDVKDYAVKNNLNYVAKLNTDFPTDDFIPDKQPQQILTPPIMPAVQPNYQQLLNLWQLIMGQIQQTCGNNKCEPPLENKLTCPKDC